MHCRQPTAEQGAHIKALLLYDKGKLYWRYRGKPSAKGFIKKFAGKPAGYITRRGYWAVRIDGIEYLQHRIIWWLNYGFWPIMLDHRDRNRLNNILDNLRLVNFSQNAINSDTVRDDSQSGVKGVYIIKGKARPFRAMIRKDSKLQHIGYFGSLDQASFARREREKALFGEFSPHASPER